MKKSILVFTFVMSLGSMVSAKDTTTATGSVLLNSNNADAFQSYVGRQVPMFYQLNSDSWKTFNKVVTYFNNSTSKLLKMNETDRKSFLIAASQIEQELSIMNSRDSKKWIDMVRKTTAVIRFTWDGQKMIDVEFEQPPVMQPTVEAIDTTILG